MDLAVRTLRDGRADGAQQAPLLLLADALAVVGGPALLRRAITDLAAAIAGGRAQASGLLLLALERPAAHYMQLCSLTSVSLTVLDGFSDPHGWGSLLGGQAARGGSGGSNNGHVVLLPGILAAADGPQQLQQQLSAAAAAAGLQQCIVIDSLSPLLDAWGPAAVAQLLHSVQAAPATSCLLCGVHADLHPPATIAALEQLAAGSLQLTEASELECSMCAAAHGATPQGRLAVRLKRAAGRVRAESQLYAIDASGAVTFLEPPADLLNAAAAVGKAAGAAAGGDAVSGLAQQLAGGMRLGLSRAEAEAKARVQLPFEHQGQSAAYQTGDFRDYLPPEAGGRARPGSAAGNRPAAPGASSMAVAAGGEGQQQQQQPQQRLGRILYVRDSASEPEDSDEDPDDDLDI